MSSLTFMSAKMQKQTRARQRGIRWRVLDSTNEAALSPKPSERRVSERAESFWETLQTNVSKDRDKQGE